MKKIKKVISENSDLFTISLSLLALLVTIYVIEVKLQESERTLINVLSIVGTMTSIFGLSIAFIQILTLKEISEHTQLTISETKNKLILGISISDVTESLSLVSDIDSFIGNQKYEIARLKLIDLRYKLIQFKSSDEFKIIVHEGRIKEIIETINIQISILYNIIFSEIDLKFDSDVINSQLQEIATYLADFKNIIKYQTI